MRLSAEGMVMAPAGQKTVDEHLKSKKDMEIFFGTNISVDISIILKSQYDI